jgi:hypothetical protein
MSLAGANPAATVTGLEELPGTRNYLIGNDPAKWRTNVPTYAKVKYQSVYPGIDLVYYGNPQHLEYDFLVAPGADPSAIALKVSALSPSAGERGLPLHIDPNGDLVMQASEYEVRLHKPVVYQTGEDSARHFVDGRYRVTRDGQVTFAVAAYDPGKLLVIDPVLTYSTYLGGSAQELFQLFSGIAVDAAGHAYVTGNTASTDFPTASPLQPVSSGVIDAFVAKLTPDGSALVYSTYLGGSGTEFSLGIAVNTAGHASVTGYTESTDFPTASPLQPVLGGREDAFVAKLTPDGSALVYSTYLGGNGGDQGHGIAVDAAGHAYVTGSTVSTDFPTANPLQAGSGGFGFADAFVAKLTSDGSALVYSTYLGGSGGDSSSGIAVDAAGSAYVTGSTVSTDFPTANPLQPVFGGGFADAFVAKLTPDGSALVFSTYLGGSGGDSSFGIAVDAAGSAYVTGPTGSTDFPTVGPVQPVFGGVADAFVTKIGSETIPSIFYEIVSRNSDKCLDVAYASAEARASVIQWICHGGPNQQWRLEPVSDGAVRIIAHHSGQVLDVYGGLMDDVTPIIQFPWHGGDNQRWTVEPASNGYMFIVARHSGKVLDVEGGSLDDGARVIQYTVHGGANQQWLLRAVAPAADPITTLSDREP